MDLTNAWDDRDADVIVVGAGPTGLMLAAELWLTGVRPLVLERQPQPRDIPKAGGLGGQILQLLRYRGLLERFKAASTDPSPRLDNGDLDVPGQGRIRPGFTRTDRGVFAFGSPTSRVLTLFTSEDESAEYDDDAPMTLTEFHDSVRRVVGADLPMGEPTTRLTRFTLQARHAERYRDGRILLAGDAAHLLPATGVALNAGLLDQPLRRLGALIAGRDIRYPAPGPNPHALTGTFTPDLALHTDQGPTSVAELMHTARPILLDLADRPDLREVARAWQHRIDIRTAGTDHRPADALLIRPDAYIAWAATIDEPTDTAAPALRSNHPHIHGGEIACLKGLQGSIGWAPSQGLYASVSVEDFDEP